MKTTTLLLSCLLAGCQTTGGNFGYCAQFYPQGSNAYATCVIQKDAQDQRIGMEGLRMLYGQAARGYR